MKRETRTGEVQTTTEDGLVEVLAVAYGVVDDYGSLWMPGVFARDLESRMPTMAWAHDWQEPIGRGVSYREAAEGLYVTFRLDINNNVPRADQAWAQFRSGTIDDVSVGFLSRERRDPTPEERRAFPGVTQVEVEADLDETSPVLRGAVPGAKLVSVRSARAAGLSFDDAVEIAKRKAAGELSDAEADALIDLLSSDDDAPPPPADEADPAPELDEQPLDEAAAELVAEAEQIINRSR